MNPYPFASLNHFTIPVAMKKHLLYQLTNGSGKHFSPTRYSLCGDHSVAPNPQLARQRAALRSRRRRAAGLAPAAPSSRSEVAVARIGCVLPPDRTRRDELHGDRLRDLAGLVPDDVDVAVSRIDERVVIGVRRVDMRRAVRVVTVVGGHGAQGDDHEARTGMRVPARVWRARRRVAGGRVPGVLLDVEIRVALRLDQLLPVLRKLAVHVREDVAEPRGRERAPAEAVPVRGEDRADVDGSPDRGEHQYQ